MRTLRDTTAERVRSLRIRNGMSQQDLADRMNHLGARVDRSVVAKVEAGKRALSLEDVFRFALALDVAPVHLIVPVDGDDPIHLAPQMEASPAEIRNWIRGFQPMFQDPRVYFTVVPLSETRAAGEALAAWEDTAPIKVTTTEEEG